MCARDLMCALICVCVCVCFVRSYVSNARSDTQTQNIHTLLFLCEYMCVFVYTNRRCKLYVLRRPTWKERGHGELAFVLRNRSNRVDLQMRHHQTKQIVMNHPGTFVCVCVCVCVCASYICVCAFIVVHVSLSPYTHKNPNTNPEIVSCVVCALYANKTPF